MEVFEYVFLFGGGRGGGGVLLDARDLIYAKKTDRGTKTTQRRQRTPHIRRRGRA
jgi:hypothetical protein